MDSKKSKKVPITKSENNKKNRKQRLFFLLASLNLAWAGVITGIVLRLKDSDQLSDNDFYGFNDDGDLIIKGQLPKTYANKYVYGVFVDENGKEHKVEAKVDPYGKFEFDTKTLPVPGKYKLNKIVDSNNNVIHENDKLRPEQKISISKPTLVNIYEDQKDEKHIEAKVNKVLVNKTLIARFVDQNNQVHTIEARVGLDEKVDLDTSGLKDGNVYHLTDIILKDSNPITKVVNTNDIDPSFKKIDKTHTYNKDGNVVLKVDLTNKIKNPALSIAVFKDENGKEHLIPATNAKNGAAHFDTKKLPLNHKYKLDRIIDNVDLNKVLVPNNELVNEHKFSIEKPTKAGVKFVENKKVYEVDLGTQLKNTPIELTLKDLNNKKIKINAKTDEMGRAVFDVSSLGDNNLYEVVGIKKPNQVGVTNLQDIPYHNKIINNLNSDALNTPYQYTKNGDINLIAKVAPYYVNQQVYGIFKDQNNKEHQVLAKVKKDGTVEFDTGLLKNHDNYSLDRIVSISNPKNVLVSNFDLARKQKQLIKKPAAKPSIDATKKAQILENLNDDLINQKLIATFVDNNNKEYKVIGVVDQNNKIVFESDSLPKCYIYHLSKVENNDLNKVVNKNDFELKDITIDKRYPSSPTSRPSFEYDNEGNLEIHTELPKELSDDLKQKAQTNGSTKAIVVDQNGVEHEVETSVDTNGKVIVKTKNLPNGDPSKPNTYTLKKLVLKQNGQPNTDLIGEKQLNGDNHTSFQKPTVVAKVKENNDYEISFSNPNLVNKKIKLTFKTDDNDSNTKTIEATIGLDGKANFKTSDDTTFEPNHKYTLTKIEADNKNVANIEEIPLVDRIINKQKNGNINGDNKHEFNIPNQKNKDLIGIYKDKNNNEIHVPIKPDDKGKAIVDPNNSPFDSNKIYEFDKIIDPSQHPNKTILDKNGINKDVGTINDDLTKARKIVLKTPTISNLTPNAVNLQISLFDLNKLSHNRQFALTIAKVSDLSDTQKYIATYDPETNNYKLNFDFTHLDANTKYKVVDVELLELNNKEKPIKLVKDDVLNFEFTTNSIIRINEPIWTKFNANVKANNDTTLTFEINDEHNVLKNDQKIYGELSLLNNKLEDLNEPTLSISFNKTNGIVELKGTSLKGNSKYSIKNLYYLDENNNKVYLFKNDVTKYEQSFITNQNAIDVSFDKNNSKQEIFANSTNLFVDYNDQDQKLQIDNPIQLEYEYLENGKPIIQIAYGKVIENNQIQFSLFGLKEKTVYTLKRFSALVKNPDSIKPYIFNELDTNANSFETSYAKTTLVNLVTKDHFANNEKVLGQALISIGTNFKDNQQIQLIYKSTDHKEIKSKPITLLKDQKSYSFEFEQLLKNRTYNFKKWVYVNNNNNNNEDGLTLSHIKDSFSIDPSNNAVSLANNNLSIINRSLENNTNSSIIAKLEINDVDDILTTTDQFDVFYKSTNSANDQEWLGIETQIIVENNKKYFQFKLSGLSINQNYAISRIVFKNKPQKALFNVANNKNNNVIFTDDTLSEISFKNEINGLKYTPQSIDETNKSVPIQVEIQADDYLLNNKYLRIQFKRLSDNEIVWSEPTLFNKNNLTINLNNLINNRAYEFVGLYYFDNNTSANAVDEQKINFTSQITPSNIVFKPSTTRIDVQTNSFATNTQSDYASVSFDLVSNDQVFENDQVVMATFEAVNGDKTQTIEQEAKLVYKNNKWNVIYNLSQLQESTKYRLTKVWFKTKPTKAYTNLNSDTNNVVYEYKNNAVEHSFTTISYGHQVVAITSNDEIATTSQNIQVKISGLKKEWRTNTKAKIIYSSNASNENDVVSQEITLDSTTNTYTFTLNNLNYGRKYTFKKLELSFGNPQQTIDFPLSNSVNNNKDSFEVLSQNTIAPINLVETQDRAFNKLNEAKIRIQVNDNENLLSQDEVATITYDINRSVDAKVIVENSKKYLEATFNNLVLNKNSVINKIEFKTKPKNAPSAIGKNKDNVIYNNALVSNSNLVINNNFEINGPLASNNAESVKNVSATNAKNTNAISLNLNSNINTHISKDLFFKAKYVPINDQGNESIYDASEAVYSNVLSADDIANNKISFNLGNLQTNRKYKLKAVYYLTSRDTNVNESNIVTLKSNVKSEIIVAPGNSTIEKYGDWSQTPLANKSTKISFKLTSADGNVLDTNIVATVVYESTTGNPKDTKTLTTNLKQVGNDWIIETDLSNLKPQTTYTLKSISISKPSKTHTNLLISTLPSIDIRTQVADTVLNELSATSPLTWVSNNANNQTISATFSGVNDSYANRLVKLVYQYNYRGSMVQVESNAITLQKDQTTYSVSLPISVPNRVYSFVKAKIQTTVNGTDYVDLNTKANLANSFTVNPGKTSFECTQPTSDQITYQGLNSLSIKIKSEDKSLVDNKEVTVWFRSDNDSRVDTIKWTRKLANTNGDGSEASLADLVNLNSFKEETEYYIYKVEFHNSDKGNLPYGNVPANANKVVYEWRQGQEKPYKFTTKVRDHKANNITSNSSINTTTQNITMTVSGIKNDWVNKKVQLVYTSNDGHVVNSNEVTITKPTNYNSSNDNNTTSTFNFSLNGLKHNREYTLTSIKLIGPNNTKVDFPKNDGLTNKFSVNPSQAISATSIVETQNRNANVLTSAQVKIALTDVDDVLVVDDQATIVYDDNKNATGKIVVEGNNKYLQATLSELVLNQDAVIKTITFNTKPTKAHANVGLNNLNKIFDSTTNNSQQLVIKNNFKVSGPLSNEASKTMNVAYDNKNNVSISLDLDVNEKIVPNLRFIARFKDNNQQNKDSVSIASSAIKTVGNKKVIEFNLSSLDANRKYSFDELYYLVDQNNNTINSNHKLTKANNVVKEIIVAPGNSTITKTNDSNNVGPNSFDFKFKIETQDGDVLENSLQAKVKFKGSDNTNKEQTVNLVKEGNNWFIKGTLSNLSPEITYTFQSIELLNKPTKTHTNLKLVQPTQPISIKTSPGDFKVTSITSDATTNGTSHNITVNLDGVNDGWVNKKLKVTYKSSDGQDIVGEATLSKTNKTYTINLNGLKPNRAYTFNKVELVDGNNKTTFAKDNSVSDSFITNSKQYVSVVSVSESTNRNTNNLKQATMRFELSDPEDVLTDNETATITYKNNQEVVGTVVSEKGKKYLQATISGLVFNENLEINKIEFKTRPQKAGTNIGANNNVIYELTNSTPQNNKLIINNDFKVVIQNDSQTIEHTPNQTSQSIKVKINKHISKNLKFKLKFTNTKGDTVYSDVLDDTKIKMSGSDQIVEFSLKNLLSNQQYIFNGIYYYSDNNTNATPQESNKLTQDNNVVKNIITKPKDTTISKHGNWTVSENSASFEFTVTSLDGNDVLDNLEATVVFKKDNQTKQTKVNIIKQGSQYLIKGNLSGLSPNSQYTLESISLSKPTKVHSDLKIIYNNKQNITFTTEVDATTLVSVQTADSINTNTQTVTVNVSGVNSKYAGRKLKLTYRSNSGEDIHGELTLEKNRTSYSLTLNNLVLNRQYSLTKVDVQNGLNEVEYTNIKNNVVDNFATQPGNSSIEWNAQTSATEISPTGVKISFKVKSPDKVLENNQTIRFWLAPANSVSDQNSWKMFSTAKLSQTNNDKTEATASLDLRSGNYFDEETTYKLVKVEFVNKPTKAYQALKSTNTNNNIIFENQNSSYQFTTSVGDHKVSNLIYTTTPGSALSQNINLTLSGIRNAWVNQKVKLTYTSSDGTSVSSNEVVLTKSKKSYDFVINIGLKHNRTYTLQKIELINPNNQNAVSNLPQNNGLNKVFTISSNNKVSVVNIVETQNRAATALGTANVEFTLNDQDDVLTNGLTVTITYNTNKTVTGTISVANGQKKLSATLTDLALNRITTINKIEFSQKPPKSAVAIGHSNTNKIYDSTIDTNNALTINNNFKLSGPSTNVQITKNASEKASVTTTLELDVNEEIIHNLKLKAKFTATNGDVVESEVINGNSVVTNGSQKTINAVLKNLKANQLYTLTDLYYNLNNNAIVEANKVVKSNDSVSRTILISPGNTTIAKEGNWSEPSDTEATYKFSVSTEDNNGTLSNGITATVKFKNGSNTIVSVANLAKESDKWTISGKLTNLTPNTKYVLEDITLSKPSSVHDNFRINITNKPNISVTTQVGDPVLKTISKKSDNANNQKTISISLSGVNSKFANRQIRLVYKDNNDQVYTSGTVDLVKGKNDYDLVLNNLVSNREYRFDKIEVNTIPNGAEFNSLQKENNATNTFTINPGNTSIEWTDASATIVGTRGVNFNFKIKSDDKILENNQEVIAWFAPKESIDNQSTWLQYIRPLSNVNTDKTEATWSHDLSNSNDFKEETTYQLVELQFKNKPTKAKNNVNNKENNIIIDNINGSNYQFTTKIGDHKLTSITSTPSINTTSQDVDLVLSGVKKAWVGKQLKLVYSSSDSSETISATINIEQNKTSYRATLSGLKRNRTYTLTGVNLVDDTSVTTFPKQTNLKDSFITTRTAAVSAVSIEETSNRVANNLKSTTVKIVLNDPDNVLKANDQATIRYGNNQSVTTNVVVSGNQKYLQTTLTNLEFNTNTNISNISFATKPSVAAQNIGTSVDNNIINNGSSPTLTISNDFKLTSPTSNIRIVKEANQKNNVQISFQLKSNPKIINNLLFKAKFRGTNNEIVETDVVNGSSLNNTNGVSTINFVLNNLKANQLYTLVDVYYLTDANSNNIVDANIISKENNVSREVQIKPSSSTIQKSGEWPTTDTSVNFKFLVTTNDNDGELGTDATATVTFNKNGGSSKTTTVNLSKEGNKWFIKGELTGLDVDSTYNLSTISVTKSSNIYTNISATLYDASFKTQPGPTVLNSLTVANDNINTNSQTINAVVSGVNDSYNNRQIRLIYKDNNDATYETNWVSLTKNNKNYTFTLNNLPANRSYRFDSVKIKNTNDNNSSDLQKASGLTNTFTRQPSRATIEYSAPSALGANNVTFKLTIRSDDQVLANGQQVSVYLLPKNSNSIDQNFKWTRTLTNVNNNGSQGDLSIDISSGLNEQTEYKVVKVEFTQKPPKAHTNLLTNNVIYEDVNSTHKFKTLAGPTMLNSLSVTNQNISTDIQTISAIFSGVNDQFKDRQVKLVYQDNNNQTYETGTVTLVKDTNTYNFVLNNLPANRSYRFVNVKINDRTNSVNFTDLSKATNVNNTFKRVPSTTSIEWTNPTNITHNGANLSLKLKSADQVFETNQDVVVYLVKTSEPNGTPLQWTRKISSVNQNKTEATINVDISSGLNEQTEYKLLKVMFTSKPRLANENLSPGNTIPNTNANYKFTTESGPTILNSLSVDQSTISNSNQTIHAVFSGVNNEYNNRKVKLIYRDQNNEKYETGLITLTKNKKNYDFTINNLVGNRNYTFEKVQISSTSNDNSFVDLSKNNSLTNIFKRSPSATSIEYSAPTTLGATNATFKLTIKSADKVLANDQEVSVYLLKQGQTQIIPSFKWTKRLSNVKSDGSQADLNIDISSGLEEQTEYRVVKVEFKQKPPKAYENLLTNNVVYNEINSNHKFTTISGPTTIRSISSTKSEVKETNQTINVVVSGVNNSYVGRKIKLAYKDNNGTIVWTNEVPLAANNKKDYSFNLNNLTTNREYTFFKAQITNTNNSNNYSDLTTTGITHKFGVTPYNSYLTINSSSWATNISENGANISVDITSTDQVFENDQQVEATFVSMKSPQETKKFVGKLSGVNVNNKNNAKITWILTGLKPETEYKLTNVKFVNKPPLAKWMLTANKNNVVFGGAQTYKFKTLNAKPTIVSIVRGDVNNPGLITLFDPNMELGKVDVTLSRVANQFNNKNVRIVYSYIDNNNGHRTNWESDPIKLTTNNANKLYQFSLRRLLPNRRYKFERIEIQNGSSWETFIDNTNKQNEFNYKPSQTRISIRSGKTFKNDTKVNEATVEFGIDSQDKFFEENQEYRLIFRSTRDTSHTKEYTARVSEVWNNNNSANLIHKLTNLDELREYYLDKVILVNRPSKLAYGPNENANNEIFSSSASSERYTFMLSGNYNATKEGVWETPTTTSAKYKFNITTTNNGTMLNTNSKFELVFNKVGDNTKSFTQVTNLVREGYKWILKGELFNLESNTEYVLSSIRVSRPMANGTFDLVYNTNINIIEPNKAKFKTQDVTPSIVSLTSTNINETTQQINLNLQNVDSRYNNRKVRLSYVYNDQGQKSITKEISLVGRRQNYEIEFNNLIANRVYTLNKIELLNQNNTTVQEQFDKSAQQIQKSFTLEPSRTSLSNYTYENDQGYKYLMFEISNKDKAFILAQGQSIMPKVYIKNVTKNIEYNLDYFASPEITQDPITKKIIMKIYIGSTNNLSEENEYQLMKVWLNSKPNNDLNKNINNSNQHIIYEYNARPNVNKLYESDAVYKFTQSRFIGTFKSIIKNEFEITNYPERHVKFGGYFENIFNPGDEPVLNARVVYKNLRDNKLYYSSEGKLSTEGNNTIGFNGWSDFRVNKQNKFTSGTYVFWGIKYWGKTGEQDAYIAYIDGVVSNPIGLAEI
ncbi:DUF1410 domain-containing protein [Ureaplasma urealyticum]